LTLGFFYQKRDCTILIGFLDSNKAGDFENRKSTSGFVFRLSSGPINQSSKRQPIVVLLSIEVEYHSLTESVKESI
jgi:hypothetical protein